uniref:RNase III domain-containing protein n=1 Tax=Echinostoma caproni TaxID=27848 RepID=A0A183AUN3_9TREM
LKRRTITLKQKKMPEEDARDVTYEIIYGLIMLSDEDTSDEDAESFSVPRHSSHIVAQVLAFVLFEPAFPDNLYVDAGK